MVTILRVYCPNGWQPKMMRCHIVEVANLYDRIIGDYWGQTNHAFIGLTKPSITLATLLMPLTVPLSVFRQIYVKTPTLIEVLWRVKVLFMGSRHHRFGEMSDIARSMNVNYVNGNSHAPRIVDGLQATMNDMAMMAQAIRGKI